MTHDELVRTVKILRDLAMNTPEGRAAFIQSRAFVPNEGAPLPPPPPAEGGASRARCDGCGAFGNGSYFRGGWWALPAGWFTMQTDETSLVACSIACIIEKIEKHGSAL